MTSLPGIVPEHHWLGPSARYRLRVLGLASWTDWTRAVGAALLGHLSARLEEGRSDLVDVGEGLIGLPDVGRIVTASRCTLPLLPGTVVSDS